MSELIVLIFGVDPGSRVTGYGLLESYGGRIGYAVSGHWALPQDLSVSKRSARLLSILQR